MELLPSFVLGSLCKYRAWPSVHPQYPGELWPRKRGNVTAVALPLSSLCSPWKNHPELPLDDANHSKVFSKASGKSREDLCGMISPECQGWGLSWNSWCHFREVWESQRGIQGWEDCPQALWQPQGSSPWHLGMEKKPGIYSQLCITSFSFLFLFSFLFFSTFCLEEPWFNHPKLHLCNTAVSLWPKRAQSKAQPAQCSPNLPNLTVPDKSELRFSSSSCLCEFWNESGSSGAVPGGWEKQMLLQYLREWEVMTLVITGLSDWYWAWNGCWRIWLIKD